MVPSGKAMCFIYLFILFFYIYKRCTTGQRFGVDKIFLILSLIRIQKYSKNMDQKYSKNSNIVKYYYNLK